VVNSTQVNSAFYPSAVGKSSTGLSCWGVHLGSIHLCQVTGNTVIPYGKCHSVAVRWSSIDGYTLPLLLMK